MTAAITPINSIINDNGVARILELIAVFNKYLNIETLF